MKVTLNPEVSTAAPPDTEYKRVLELLKSSNLLKVSLDWHPHYRGYPGEPNFTHMGTTITVDFFGAYRGFSFYSIPERSMQTLYETIEQTLKGVHPLEFSGDWNSKERYIKSFDQRASVSEIAQSLVDSGGE